LSDAVAEVQRLKRDLTSAESELGAVSRDKSEAQGEVRRLAQKLASEEAVKRSMKRKLDAFTSGSSGGGPHNSSGGVGAVIAGLQLQHLDLTECVCEVRNATNMDVSLAGWTVRVVADASLVVETAGPDGSVRGYVTRFLSPSFTRLLSCFLHVEPMTTRIRFVFPGLCFYVSCRGFDALDYVQSFGISPFLQPHKL
jgi:hypothetical protein